MSSASSFPRPSRRRLPWLVFPGSHLLAGDGHRKQASGGAYGVAVASMATVARRSQEVETASRPWWRADHCGAQAVETASRPRPRAGGGVQGRRRRADCGYVKS
ncbi:hypothetical protein GQ55_9G284300 [Panicum hallii var. hallii]|uniref:Uncharacterized protein n=1 Tax=Panicum hallii var. hallii TaxID=1504633 RepID=A0A2T7C7I3_9POAL|nr:hypothetical protein GQ55_9G284300 [Panicum hallii var. hallii]